MKTSKHILLSVFILLALYVTPAISTITDLHIQNYVLISGKRIDRFVWEYTYRADITNTGNELQNVTATIVSTPSHTTVIDGNLAFGTVPSQATVTSSDTFMIRHDRRYKFNVNELQWSLQGQPPDTTPPIVNIIDPTPLSGYATTDSTLSISGLADDNEALSLVEWRNEANGTSGIANGLTSWSVSAINLVQGDNLLIVKATDMAGNIFEDKLIVTYNINGVVFFGVPKSTPDAIFVGEATDVLFTQAVFLNSQVNQNSVTLEIQYPGGPVDARAMYDDGILGGHGDEIEGDGIFSAWVPGITYATVGEIPFRVKAEALNNPGSYAYSPVSNLSSLVHLDPTSYLEAIELAENAQTQFDALLGQTDDISQALMQLVDWLKNQQTVADAGVSESGQGAWWVTNAGILGGLLGYDQNVNRGGSRMPIIPYPSIQLRNDLEGINKFAVSAVEPQISAFTSKFSLAADDTIKVGSHKAAVIAPYFYNDEPDDIENMMKNSQCPNYDVSSFPSPNAGVNIFKTLHNYGIIVIASHGDTWYKGILSLWKEKWGWNWWGAQVAILTDSQANEGNLATYEIDLQKGRLAVTPGGRLAVLPAFISYYNGAFPKSLVYVGSCRSSYNDSMAYAFLGNGAKTYFGYTEYVSSSFARDQGIQLFTNLINNRQTTGEAFTPGQHDNNSPPAYFTMRGSDKLTIADTDLVNGSFETGNLSGWSKDGDGRVIAHLGAANPTDGNFMGIISTGLGYTTASGSISQAVCVPTLPTDKSAVKMVYNWNFYSEEFLEWCGSIYQDYFRVDFGSTNLQYNAVDSLCSSVSPADVSFDQGGVYKTGWRTQTVDMTPHAGQGRLLKFSAGDVGDSIYDSAILLDNIRFEFE